MYIAVIPRGYCVHTPSPLSCSVLHPYSHILHKTQTCRFHLDIGVGNSEPGWHSDQNRSTWEMIESIAVSNGSVLNIKIIQTSLIHVWQWSTCMHIYLGILLVSPALITNGPVLNKSDTGKAILWEQICKKIVERYKKRQRCASTHIPYWRPGEVALLAGYV